MQQRYKFRILVPIFVLLVVLYVAFTLAIPSANAQSGGDGCKTLSPAPINELVAPEFEVTLQRNRVTVHGYSYVAPGHTFRGFEWGVDLKNCTYYARWITADKPPSNNTVIDEYFSDRRINPGQADSIASIPTGNYLAGIKIVSKDPPGFWLAATTNKLYWTTYSDGTVQWYRYVKGCQGYTTPLNTHWYVSGCWWSSENPYYSANHQQVYSRIQGSYYNYDFMDPNKRTDAVHYSKITGLNIMERGSMNGGRHILENLVGYYEARWYQTIRKL